MDTVVGGYREDDPRHPPTFHHIGGATPEGSSRTSLFSFFAELSPVEATTRADGQCFWPSSAIRPAGRGQGEWLEGWPGLPPGPAGALLQVWVAVDLTG